MRRRSPLDAWPPKLNAKLASVFSFIARVETLSRRRLTPARARWANIDTRALQALERRKLIEVEWTLRRPSWLTARLSERGRAYAVVLETQRAASDASAWDEALTGARAEVRKHLSTRAGP